MNSPRIVHIVLFAAVALFGRVCLAQERSTTAPSPFDALHSRILALTAPVLDESRRADAGYMSSAESAYRQWEEQRCDLIKELFTRFPDHPQAFTLMLDRWTRMSKYRYRQEVVDETDTLLEKPWPAKDRVEILYARAMAKVLLGRSDQSAPAVEELVAAAPQDERAAEVLTILGLTEHDPKKSAVVFRKVMEGYAATKYEAMAKGFLRKAESIGKPFDLDFADVASGKPVSVQKDLKGKVVIILFWATWCAPCIAEMPEQITLYNKYTDQGVEFIGVSMDRPEADGGLKALKDGIERNNIPWPQYYQGNGFEGEFSMGWGIRAVPTVFVVDKNGILVNVNARGQIEPWIRSLLGYKPDRSNEVDHERVLIGEPHGEAEGAHTR